MEKELAYWTESAAEWQARAEHFTTVALYYETKGPQYAAPIAEAREDAAWAAEKALNARAQLAKLEAQA